MNGTSNSTGRTKAASREEGKPPPRAGIIVAAILLVLFGCFFAFKSFLAPSGTPASRSPAPTATLPESAPSPAQQPGRVRNDFQSPPVVSLTAAQPASRPSAASGGSLSARQLVAELVELSALPGPLTKEQAEKLKQNLEELIRQGASSVPAIREFLEKNIEYDYADLSGGDQLGYSSLRASLFDALRQIGGPEAQTAMLQVLQTTASPAELLELAKNLQTESPGLYRDQILTAAREALTLASTGQLGTNTELGPAFRMLQNYGEPNRTADGAESDPANFYQALALANLPDAQGLPSLVQMAQSSDVNSSGKIVATEMIAQLAGQNSQALDTLVQMAQGGQIRNSTWEKLAPILGGDQYQISTSTADQSLSAASPPYTVASSVTTPDQINQRLAIIDRFLGLVPSDSAAAASLQHQRGILVARLGP